jgi:hypothetical protein
MTMKKWLSKWPYRVNDDVLQSIHSSVRMPSILTFSCRFNTMLTLTLTSERVPVAAPQTALPGSAPRGEICQSQTLNRPIPRIR